MSYAACSEPFLERSALMSVLSNSLMDCGCSSACVAYKNGQFVQTPINTIHRNATAQKQWRMSVEDWRQLRRYAPPVKNFWLRHWVVVPATLWVVEA